jgi:hypothetical protein
VWISAFPWPAPRGYRSGVLYLAEFYLPAETTLARLVQQAQAGAERATRAGAEVAFVEAIFLPEDESCFALYRARSASDVTAAGSLAGLRFDRVTGAIVGRGPGHSLPATELRPLPRPPGQLHWPGW